MNDRLLIKKNFKGYDFHVKSIVLKTDTVKESKKYSDYWFWV